MKVCGGGGGVSGWNSAALTCGPAKIQRLDIKMFQTHKDT